MYNIRFVRIPYRYISIFYVLLNFVPTDFTFIFSKVFQLTYNDGMSLQKLKIMKSNKYRVLTSKNDQISDCTLTSHFLHSHNHSLFI